MKTIPFRHIFSVSLVTFCAGCATYQQVATPFNEDEFKPYLKQGTAVISGQAFLKTRGGEVRYAAGDTVYLLPVTRYTDEVMLIASQGHWPKKDPRMEKYVTKTTADGSGNFEFTELPPGEYWVECGIFWEVANLYGPGSIGRTGSYVRKKVKVSQGKRIKIILTS